MSFYGYECSKCGHKEEPVVTPGPWMLRDILAGKVINGLTSDPGTIWFGKDGAKWDENALRLNAELAYALADAMLAARDRGIENKGEVGP